MNETATKELATIASAFDLETDRLLEFADTFEELDADPFELYIDDVILRKSITEETIHKYRMAYAEWKTFMDCLGRHPACPNEQHVRQYEAWQYGTWPVPDEWELHQPANHPRTIKEKLRKLDAAYRYWQQQDAFPHPEDYNPIRLVIEKSDFTLPRLPKYPRLTLQDLRSELGNGWHVRDLAIISLQLKLGLRAGELCNIRLSDLSVAHPEIHEHYEQLGNSGHLDGRKNALYIPHNRQGNKSVRPRILPLDGELLDLIQRYLIIRPDDGENALFLSKDHHQGLGPQGVNAIWKSGFSSEYTDPKNRRPITSHYGRHFFTSFWRLDVGLNRELVKYMRGDAGEARTWRNRPENIDSYLHTYYEDIEGVYKEDIFKLYP